MVQFSLETIRESSQIQAERSVSHSNYLYYLRRHRYGYMQAFRRMQITRVAPLGEHPYVYLAGQPARPNDWLGIRWGEISSAGQIDTFYPGSLETVVPYLNAGIPILGWPSRYWQP